MIQRIVLAVVCVLLASLPARAVTYRYVDWTSADVAGGTAQGVITLPDASTVNVSFESIKEDGSAGNLFFAITGAGTNYWNPSAPYISSQVSNAPPASDLLALIGGVNQTYRVTLSEAIKDPIMAIVSLGQTGAPTIYDFDSPFDIVSQGPGPFGGTNTSLVKLAGDRLEGREGNGTVQFDGTYSTFSWIVPTPENWHGFTFGIRTTLALEPGPDPDPEPGVIPEPATAALGLLSLIGLTAAARRRR
jgi:MYXO-CTERM domain-containing protein